MLLNLKEIRASGSDQPLVATAITQPADFGHTPINSAGPFLGFATVGDDAGGAGAINIHASLITHVVIDAQHAALTVVIESPVPGHRGVKVLTFDLTFASTEGAWVVKSGDLGWLENPPAPIGRLNEWMSQPAGSGLKLKLTGGFTGRTGFPLDLLGVSTTPGIWAGTVNEHRGWLGIMRQRFPLLVFLPIGEILKRRTDEACAGIKLKGLTDIPIGMDSTDWTMMPLLLSRRLDKEGADGWWRAVVQWAPILSTGNPTKISRLRLKDFLSRAWNEPVRYALRGLRVESAGQPLVPMPLLQFAANESDDANPAAFPTLVFDIPPGNTNATSAQARLRYIHLSGDKPGIFKATFQWQTAGVGFAADPGGASAEASPPSISAMGLVFSSKALPKSTVVPWRQTPSSLHALYYAQMIDAACGPLDSDATADLLLDLSLEGTADSTVSGSWIPWGYLDIKVDPAADAHLGCKLRGRWSANECDLYPESELILRNCRVRVSAAADLAGRDLHAQFDTAGAAEDALQRDTDTLRHPLHKPDDGRICDVKVRHKTQAGRNAISRVEVYSIAAGREFGVRSLCLQMRPFIAAVVEPTTLANDAGELIAIWSSDDPEGVQWRVPDATVELVLPPQAVGETMERGVRFWDVSPPGPGAAHAVPVVAPGKPLPFRFSPPTRLTVRPAVRDRRYNSAPGNLSAVLHEAKVDAFTTEIAYPIETVFAVSDLGLPDVRVKETAAFLGRPAPNLPPVPLPEGRDLVAWKEELRRVLDADLADEAAYYAYKRLKLPSTVAGEVTLGTLAQSLDALRGRHVAVRNSFVARIAAFHLFDPWRPDGGLALRDGLNFRIRDQRHGAPPLANPLPNWRLDYTPATSGAPGFTPVANQVDLTEAQKREIHVAARADGPAFLKVGPAAELLWGDADDGAFKGGAIHTIEFASELVAILRNPVSSAGAIDSLAFTALGATGSFQCSFDEGRTTFIAETQHGQLSRLVKIRIGRLAVLWNRARHVVVYERSTVPSLQFESEQEYGGASSRGWPILRKTEEYVEPIEAVRSFDDEAQKKESRTGYVAGSEFVSLRIYVNGAWGQDLRHGYELPLWNRRDTSGFYPKPLLALRARAGGLEESRCWHDEPEHLYFYSNTEPNTGSDPDKWLPHAGVDCPRAFTRMPRTSAAMDPAEVLASAVMPSPRLGGTRRPRFDFAVVSDGKVNLQHGRGETEMLAALDVISMGRSAAESHATPTGSAEIDTLWALVQTQAQAASRFDAYREVEARANTMIAQAAQRLLTAGGDCQRIKDELKAGVENLLGEVEKQLATCAVPPIPAIDVTALAVKNVAEQLAQFEDVLQAAFGSVRQDIARLRSSARGDLVAFKVAAKQQIERGRNQIDHVFVLAVERITVMQSRVTDAGSGLKQLAGVAGQTVAEVLDQVAAALAALDTALAGASGDLGKATRSLSDARLALDRLSSNPVVGATAGKLATMIAAVERAVAGTPAVAQQCLDALRAFIKDTLGPSLSAVVTGVGQLTTDAMLAVDFAHTSLGDVRRLLAIDLANLLAELDAAGDAAIDTVFVRLTARLDAVCAEAGVGTTAVEATAMGLWRRDVRSRVLGATLAAATHVDAALASSVGAAMELARQIAAQLAAATADAARWLNAAKHSANDAIDLIDCGLIADTVAKAEAALRDAMRSAEAEIRDRVSGIASEMLDEDTRRNLRELEEKVAALAPMAQVVSDGLKLVKSIGELPALPTLTFNAARAEYLFDDLKKEIETSPFAAKLREIDTGMKALGLAVPARQLLDQIVPDSLKDMDFGKVFRNFGGIDFEGLFKRFRLPQIDKDQLKITHGLDKASRSAWVKTQVDVDHPKEETLFEIAGLAVRIAKLALHATSDARIAATGERQAATDARFAGDWGLDFGGARLATFREVTVRYDGSRFDFDLSPDKVDLHPALAFVSEFAKQFKPDLPPAIELINDSRGVPMGAKASMTNLITLPSLGAIEIGPLLIATGLSLQVQNSGKFVVATHLSVGSKKVPVWVQIGYLGGGLWLEAQATYEGSATYSATLGLAIGSTRAINIAGVARGSYSLLLFAYAEMSNSGGSLRGGFSMAGSARILGIANASLYLLLEVIYQGGGEAQGHGLLDVSIDICWCYSIHVRKEVQQKIGG